MKGTHIVNVFGKNGSRKAVKQQPMIITKNDGTRVIIPAKAITQVGFLKESVAKRITSNKVDDIIWLNTHYGIEFEFDADKAAAVADEKGGRA